MRLFDTHCHIYDEDYKNDFDEMIARAKENKVELLLVPADTLESAYTIDKMTKEYDCIYGAVGIHPESCKTLDNLDETIVVLEELVKSNNKIKAIGEIGLDYHWENTEEIKRSQKVWLIKQIELANKLHVPIVIHSRDACDDTLTLLKDNMPRYGCVFHCFSYSEEVLNQILKLGFYIGLDGPVTYKNSINPKHIAKVVPLDRLVVETDSPFLPPVPYRGKRNEPSYVTQVVLEIAALKGLTYEEIAKATFYNGLKLFGIDYE